MKCLAFLLAISLAWVVGCSKDEPAPKPAPKKSGAVGGPSGPGGMAGEGGEDPVGGMEGSPQPAGGTQRVNADPQTPPVLAEMDGRFFEVYEIAKEPYTGKVVLYHATGVEKLEKVYKDGHLERLTEWHDNGQKSHEVTYAANGGMIEKRWNKNGQQIGTTASTGAHGRGITWTYGGGESRTRIDGYTGKSADLIKRVFGAPDDEQNGVLIYKGMKVTAVRSGQIMTVVRFTIANGQVLSVNVEP